MEAHIQRVKRRGEKYIPEKLAVLAERVRYDDEGKYIPEALAGHYLNFFTIRGEYRTYMRMKDVETEFCHYGFFRTNKGILINLRYVDSVENNCCLVNEKLLPISRGKKKDFMEALNLYMSRH